MTLFAHQCCNNVSRVPSSFDADSTWCRIPLYGPLAQVHSLTSSLSMDPAQSGEMATCQRVGLALGTLILDIRLAREALRWLHVFREYCSASVNRAYVRIQRWDFRRCFQSRSDTRFAGVLYGTRSKIRHDIRISINNVRQRG